MKRCPECNSFFPNSEQFCELDGTPLETVDDASDAVRIDRPTAAPRSQSSGSLLTIGALLGLLLGVLLFLVYFAMTRQTAQENSNTSSAASISPQQQPLRPLQPPANANPSPEPSAEPSPSPSVQASPSPQNSATHVELSSSNPSSTATGARGRSEPVIIRLNSGATIEADEAWQTPEGIWYRKSSVVSLIDPKDVKAIEKVPPAVPQPSAATATPSP